MKKELKASNIKIIDGPHSSRLVKQKRKLGVNIGEATKNFQDSCKFINLIYSGLPKIVIRMS